MYKRRGYIIDIIKQSACLPVNPITIDHLACLFNCTLVDRGSDSMMAQPKTIHYMVWAGAIYVCFSAHRGSTVGFLLLQYLISVV